MLPLEISVAEATALLNDSGVLLVDCREPDEVAICALPGATFIPLGEFAERAGELAPRQSDRVIIYCHHGMRSFRAAAYLRQQGFTQAQSLAGGIDAWAAEAEPGMARY